MVPNNTVDPLIITNSSSWVEIYNNSSLTFRLYSPSILIQTKHIPLLIEKLKFSSTIRIIVKSYYFIAFLSMFDFPEVKTVG